MEQLPVIRPPGYRWRLVLGLALIVPVPLIAITIIAYATGDFKHAPIWVDDWMIYSIPILSLIGFAVLPVNPWLRAGLGCVMVPLICFFLIIWTLMFVCNVFGDCMKWSLV